MKLIIFDFDGVLVDTLIMSYEISKEINQDMSVDTFRSLFNGNFFTSMESNPKFKNHPQFTERYETKSREIKIPQSLKDIIHALHKDYTLAIVSSTQTPLIEKIVAREKVASYFADILGGDLHKSKVVKNKMLLEKYSLMSKDAVYITDTVGDVIEARECNMKSIAVTWGFHDKKMLQKINPDKIVNTPDELLKAIKEI